MSADGVAFSVYEPSPSHRKWFSHKFKGSILRYEIIISLSKREINRSSKPFCLRINH